MRTQNNLLLRQQRGTTIGEQDISTFSEEVSLVSLLKKRKEPIAYDEIKYMSKDYGGDELKDVEKVLRRLDAAIAVPSFIENSLIAIIMLGKKRSEKNYTPDDLAVFAILANQSALAIENAMFYDDMKRTHAQLFKAEKMATIGTMADGLSHQINNRLHAMGFIAGDILDTIKLAQKKKLDKETLETLDEVADGLGRIQENVKHGGEIVGGLLKYTRKGDQGFTAVNLDKLLDSAIEMAQFKIKLNEIDIVRNFNGQVPLIRGNFTQLQEVFFNLIDNAYDAMMQRKEELEEKGYKPTLNVYAEKKGKKIEILLKDNGMGVKDEDLVKIFTPFFTTKATANKGTGLGMYVIRQLIEENHGGTVEFSSRYKLGSQTQILLPLATEEDKKEEKSS